MIAMSWFESWFPGVRNSIWGAEVRGMKAEG